MNLKTSQYNILVDNGWVTPTNKGCFILNEKFLSIMDLFDQIILKWAKEDNAEIFMYPDIISIEKISSCRYIEQFHHNCFFNYTSNSDEYNEHKMIPTDYIHNPSICMHSYIQQEGNIINTKEPVVLTAKGKCLRNEAKEYHTLDRLLDFTMREIVFMGSEDFVLQKRKKYMELSNQLMKDLNIIGNIKASNDPFFKREDERKSDYQRKFKLKYELNFADMDEDREVAVGSFNFHGIHFGRAFQIKTEENRYIYTACMAFGLERMAYTFITQAGVWNSIPILENYLGEKYER